MLAIVDLFIVRRYDTCAIASMEVPHFLTALSKIILVSMLSFNFFIGGSRKLMMNKSIVRPIINEEGLAMKLFRACKYDH